MLAGQHVSAEFADFVHEHTDGVPLAVEESVRLMFEREDLARRNGACDRTRWQLHRPERARLARQQLRASKQDTDGPPSRALRSQAAGRSHGSIPSIGRRALA